MKRKKAGKFIPPILMLTLILAGIIYLATHEGLTVEQIVDLTPENPWISAVVLWVLYAVKGVTVIILYDVLVLAASLMYDLPMAIFVSAVGTLICICVPYWVGRCLHGEWLERTLAKHGKLERIYRRYEQNPALGCIILRAMSLSNEAIGFLFGSTGVNFLTFLVSSAIGIAPNMLCVTLLGSEMSVRSVWFWLVLAIYVLMIIGAYWFNRKKENKQDD